MLKWSAKFRRGRITCLPFKCSLPRLFPRSYSIPNVISVALIFANYCKTHDLVWFPFTIRIATGLKMISPPASPCPSSIFLSPEDGKVRGWTSFGNTPAWTLPCPSFMTWEHSLTSLSLVIPSAQWGKLYSPCSVLGAESSYGKPLAHCTHSAIAAVIIGTKAVFIHSRFLHSWNDSGFDRGFDSTESWIVFCFIYWFGRRKMSVVKIFSVASSLLLKKNTDMRNGLL